jgi:hypothetical protein
MSITTKDTTWWSLSNWNIGGAANDNTPVIMGILLSVTQEGRKHPHGLDIFNNSPLSSLITTFSCRLQNHHCFWKTSMQMLHPPQQSLGAHLQGICEGIPMVFSGLLIGQKSPLQLAETLRVQEKTMTEKPGQ